MLRVCAHAASKILAGVMLCLALNADRAAISRSGRSMIVLVGLGGCAEPFITGGKESKDGFMSRRIET